MTALVLALLVVSASHAAAQGLPDLEATWLGSCPGCAPGAMPGGAARTLVIRLSASAVAIRRDGYPAEVYRLDGTETQLPDSRTATAMIEDGSLVITTVRRRVRSRDEVFQTILRGSYRVTGETLTIERSTRAIRPNEPPSERWAALGAIIYQRDRGPGR